MFADNSNVLVEGTLQQILILQARFRECVAISAGKAIFTPAGTAEEMCEALTDEGLRTVTVKYRRSGPLKGQVYAQPKMLDEHLRTERRNAWISRQPVKAAALLNFQVTLEVLDLNVGDASPLPTPLMNVISSTTGIVFVEVKDHLRELAKGEWRLFIRDGKWAGKICIQCGSMEEATVVYSQVHGRTICLGGIHKTIDISSPTDIGLASGSRTLLRTGPQLSD
jgi:hypothetical protein